MHSRQLTLWQTMCSNSVPPNMKRWKLDKTLNIVINVHGQGIIRAHLGIQITHHDHNATYREPLLECIELLIKKYNSQNMNASLADSKALIQYRIHAYLRQAYQSTTIQAETAECPAYTIGAYSIGSRYHCPGAFAHS